MITYSSLSVLAAATATALIAGPFVVFTLWLALKASDWAEKACGRTFGEMVSWMVYLPLGCIALASSIFLGIFIFCSSMEYLVS
ncbi:MAG: hypothetical protein [Podoviridae sp. ctda_1]|nr:MAG: hypothetical protein [Podoviridae sp. ctda_1]